MALHGVTNDLYILIVMISTSHYSSEFNDPLALELKPYVLCPLCHNTTPMSGSIMTDGIHFTARDCAQVRGFFLKESLDYELISNVRETYDMGMLSLKTSPIFFFFFLVLVLKRLIIIKIIE